MKVYLSLETLTIIKVDREKPFYQGSNFVDKIRVLFDAPLDFAVTPTITFRLPTGRRKGPIYAIGIDADTTRLIVEDDKSWYYYDFILSADTGVLVYPGQLEASIVLNYFNTNGAITKQAVTGNIVNEILKTTVYENGNIIVIGDNPEEIINDFYSTIAATANRQTSLETRQTTLEAAWENVKKLLPVVIEDNLTEEGLAKIEFWDDFIKIVHDGKVIATLSNALGMAVAGDIAADNIEVKGDITAKHIDVQGNDVLTEQSTQYSDIELNDIMKGAWV